jgi:hypothetical protein
MVHRLVVSHGQPADPAAFNAHYRETYIPLAPGQPGLVRLTFGQATGGVTLSHVDVQTAGSGR